MARVLKSVVEKLRPREQWRPGLIKEELAREISELVETMVPDVAIGISQPIQMRTNELVAGVRSDVGVILYGPDLAVLAAASQRALALIRGIAGVADARAERVSGLTYLRVLPDRGRLARYGLTIADVNQATEAISVGVAAGVVLEGERRFDMRVRVDHGFTGDLQRIAMIPLRASSGQIVPLGDVAELKLGEGPALVNREKQSRRLIVEFNVRGRDLVSVVEEVQRALDAGLGLSPGYRVEYGGTFEHYMAARDRLMIVVPLALALILFLLWVALARVRVAAIIFLNIPFAIVGGVVALWLRGPGPAGARSKPPRGGGRWW